MRKESGFTLIELMVAITIVSIIVVIAVPAWVNWIPSYRLKRATRDVFSSFQQAKLEAVRRNVNVAISFDPVNDAYTMFVDDGDGAGGVPNDFTQNGTERLLGSIDLARQFKGSVTLVSANFSGAQQAGFDSRGLSANSRFGRAILTNTKGISLDIILLITGNIRIE